MPDFTGRTERAYILSPVTGIGALAGGRLYKTAVPDGVDLPRLPDGRVKPYLVVTFQSPSSASRGRSIDGGEWIQPHIMGGMIVSYAGDADSAQELDDAVRLKLTGQRPSSGASKIRFVGGFERGSSDSTSKPTRFAVGSWFSFQINLDPTTPNP